MTVTVSCQETFPISPPELWAHIEDVSTHTTWMKDAIEIRRVSEQESGVGTEFTCLTRVGPLRNRDVLRVTEWEPGQGMTIAHTGAVAGTGRFTLDDAGPGATRLRWEEVLTFPWWMAGPLGERLAAPILRRIWRGNLHRLRARVTPLRQDY